MAIRNRAAAEAKARAHQRPIVPVDLDTTTAWFDPAADPRHLELIARRFNA